MKYFSIFIKILIVVVVMVGVYYYAKKNNTFEPANNTVTNTVSTKKKEIKEFEYMHFHYTTGNMMYAYVNYSIDKNEDGKYIATIKPTGIPDEEAKEVEVDDETLKKVIAVLNKYNVSSWNNFHKSDKGVLDGNSFSLYMKLDVKNSVEASGYMKWPKNYREVRDELNSIFEELYKE